MIMALKFEGRRFQWSLGFKQRGAVCCCSRRNSKVEPFAVGYGKIIDNRYHQRPGKKGFKIMFRNSEATSRG